MALRRSGEPAPAIDAYRAALDLWTAEGDLAGEAEARNSLGLAQKSLGEMDASRAELERAHIVLDVVPAVVTQLRRLAPQ